MNIQAAATKMSMPPYMPPGIYFGLDESLYHADASLGSTDIRRLAIDPSDYWWNSYMNPARKDDSETPAQSRGSAVHCLVLYGEAEFDRRYMRIPHTDDMSSGEKAAMTKKYNVLATAKGMTALHGPVYDNIAIASAMIARNPKLSTALVGGMNEVSIFWCDPISGIRKKCRIDCLKPRGVGDLKSITNRYDRPFPKACLDSITNYSYHVQACHYLRGRALISKLVADGCVYGDHDVTMLKAVAAEKNYAWQWIWWQSDGPPLTYSKILSPQNPIMEIAGAMIAHAERNYIDYMKRFGSDHMWLLEEDPTELYVEELPPWFSR